MSLVPVFTRLFARLAEPQIRVPPGHLQHGDGPDDAAPLSPRKLASDLEGLVIGIVYVDAFGLYSERVIRCHALERSGGYLYIRAYCKLRDDDRTFRFDRIEAVFDYTTGEVDENVDDFFAPFVADLRPAPERPAETPHQASRRAEAPMIQLYGAGATVLAFLAAADGSIHADEMRVIEGYIDERLRPLDGDKLQRRLSRQWLRAQVPTRDMAVKAMRKVAGDTENAAQVADALVTLISADGVVTEEEMQVARDMIKILERKEKKAANADRG